MPKQQLKRTPLFEAHRDLGGRMVGFGGWEMPVQYTSIVDEHTAVRTTAGLFDVSHMGEFEFRGAGAGNLLGHLMCNDIGKLSVGAVQYSMFLNERGGTIDDAMVYRTDDETYLVVVNAANIEKDWSHVKTITQKFDHVVVINRSEEYALLALQGPGATPILSALTDADVGDLGFHKIRNAEIEGQPVFVAASGYTGENGFEIFAPPEHARRIWDAILDTGAVSGVKPAGLGARDTLRLEASLALYGHELDEETSPLEAQLGFCVSRTGDYIGADVMLAQREGGLKKKLVMLEMQERGIPRQGYDVHSPAGEKAGVVTSGSVAPWLKKQIAMAYIPPDLASVGQDLCVVIRDRALRAVVVPRPFYKRPKR